MQKILLYSTSACHLCEQALAVIEPLLQGRSLQIVDIVEDEQLMQRYAIRIPVLGLEDAPDVDLGWPFTSEQVQAWMFELKV